MQSLKELYKIGNGPSSSHTMGPKRAVEIFKNKNLDADKFRIILYGSLALTGKGHLTDYIIEKTLQGYETEIEFDVETECTVHPNTFDIFAIKDNEVKSHWRVYSVGGGTFQIEGKKEVSFEEVYNEKSFNEIKKYCQENNCDLYDYVVKNEGEEIKEFLKEIWNSMKTTIRNGLTIDGMIPGKLNLDRRAKKLFETKIENETDSLKQNRLLSSYAYATNEENASGGIIVTAPTCGASGTLPAVLYCMKEKYELMDDQIIKALAVAGVIGNVIKTNASISGAECGCQAEVGTACSMAAAACTYLLGGNLQKIENAAEMGMEHHLGLTCDPIYGYVQIPCIERNAIAAMRAVESADLAMLLPEERKISFDVVVETMYETGQDLKSHYRETSEGGLAKKYCRNKFYNNEMNEIKV
ncbi:MAG: L-serine ammonia-lyase, iron-sulfur-dependent, subunit alpha [Clostridia bacterium]|nr:L-serine ammonia-lyase, iron-sulfur-dependent, subunit alpha [Clostridia bacterium]